MATMKGRLSLTLLASLLAAGTAVAADRAQLAERAAANLMAKRADLGLDEAHSFAIRRVDGDELGQTHTRFQQHYNGVRVWGGEAIVHQDQEGSFLPMTSELKANINISTLPSLSESEVLAVVKGDMAPKGEFSIPPSAELVIYPETVAVRRAVRWAVDQDADLNAMDVERQAVRYTLAYHVHVELENDLDGVRHADYLINAHTGSIIRNWDDLHTTAATGTGKSQYSGTVNLSVNSISGGWELSDVVRSMPFKTYNLNHATSGTGTIYTDTDNTWGDSANYVEGSSTTAANGQTAAVDAHYGTQVAFDFYKNLFGRNGINGAGKATYNRVHYSNSYDNAFWSDSCFCMTYGDGNSFTTLTALDVAGHEMSHGVCANSANLTYSGESGGLNESNSDILGNMIELYSRNGNTIPATVANTSTTWTLGEQLSSTPLRYMYKPSKDGSSPNAWSSSLGSLDVHYSSGPNNRMFFFLSQGASSTSSSDYYSSYTPGGFAGIGPEKAVRIWYRALTVYLTSSSDYAAARNACISAAKDLYGAGSAAEQAVWNAYAAINVGSAWGGTTPPSGNVEVEPNNSSTAAQNISTSGTTISGTMSSSTDQDWYKCSLAAGRTLTVTLTPNASSDYDLYVYNSNVTQIGSSTNGTGAVDTVSVTNTGTSTFTRYAKVIYYSGSTGSAGTYTLKMTF
jgi:Zn-dependent metalloprotease